MEDAKGAFPLAVRQAAMGNLTPDMAPRRTSQAPCWREDVRESVSILTRGPLPDWVGRGPCGNAFPDGDAWGGGALKIQPVRVGAIAFPPRPSARWSRVGGWLTPDHPKMPLLTGP